jgi:FkbH-like protein
MAESVRLVIWDLDETFWQGTVTEGGIKYLQQHHDCVVELARRGIVSTICSKNDFETVRTILENQGLWQYFVFPSINWEHKGQRIAALINLVMLRPTTVMFIDDNPMNLREAEHYSPGLQTASPSILGTLLDNPLFKGKQDTNLSRLAQYKLLEKRRQDEQATTLVGGTNLDFLRSSDVRVRIEHDITCHVDRAIELVNRTNQLNFTKNRLPEDLEKARSSILELIDQFDVQAGLVHVQDRYGDYGFVGFFVIKTAGGRSNLLHYCFSCRTIGMGIETWVYRKIGRPWLPTVGEVLGDPRDDSLSADWITFVQSENASLDNEPESEGPQYGPIVLRGGCGGLSISHYFHPVAQSVASEVMVVRAGVPIRLDHSLFLANYLDGMSAEVCGEMEKLGYRVGDFQTSLFSSDLATGVVVLDFWVDSEVAVYRHKRLGFRIPFVLPYHFPIKPEGNVKELPVDFAMDGYGSDHWVMRAARCVREEYDYEGLLSEDRFKGNLRRILSNVSRSATVFILSANETWLNPGNKIVYTYPAHIALNRWTAEIVQPFANVKFLDVRQFFQSDLDTHTVNHFSRLVYFRIYETICRLARLRSKASFRRALPLSSPSGM